MVESNPETSSDVNESIIQAKLDFAARRFIGWYKLLMHHGHVDDVDTAVDLVFACICGYVNCKYCGLFGWTKIKTNTL